MSAGERRPVTWALKASTALLCLGTAWISLGWSGPVFTWLFMGLGWSEESALGVDRAGAWLLLAAIPCLAFRRAWPALVFVSAWTAARAATQAWDEAWHPELVLLGSGARILVPLALAFAASRPAVSRTLLRAGVAAAFAGHGVEALLGKPEFVDLLLAASRKLAGLRVPETAARELLAGIGLADLLVAAAVLAPVRLRAVAAWAAVWGLLTALSRVVHLGGPGIPEALLRAVHAGAPLALFLAWKPVPVELRRSTMKRAPLAVPAAVAAVLLLFASAAGAQDPGVKPVHARVTWTEAPDRQATVSWSTAQAGSGHRVCYDVVPRGGRAEAYAGKVAAQRNGRYTDPKVQLHYHHAVLTGLRPSTTYYFVMAGDGAVSPEYRFVTAPSEDVPFRLLAGGDSRSDPKARRAMNALLASALEKDPGILALWHGGDFVARGENLAEWAEWMGDHELVRTRDGRMLPIIPVRGNHEKTGKVFDEVWNWPGGGLGKNYYALTIGPEALLVTLNTNVSVEGEQARFLERALEEGREARWQLASYHRPAYPAVKTPGSGKQAWVPIFERFDLDLVCEADGHTFKRTVPIRNDRHDPTGVVYIGEGGLGVSQRTPDDDLWYLQAPGRCAKTHHYFVLEFERTSLKTRAIRIDGSVLDEYELKPRAKRAAP
jgi:hypothetical protein